MVNNLENLLKNIRDGRTMKNQINDKFESDFIKFFRENIGIDEAGYKAISFVSMLIFYCEKNIEKICMYSIKKGVIISQAVEMIDYAFEELSFSSKINLYEKLLKKHFPQCKDLIKGVKYYRKLNDIRNKIFHCKLKAIEYKGKSIADADTKKLLINDMIESCGIEIDKNGKSERKMAAQTYKIT